MTSYLKREGEELPVRQGWWEWLLGVSSDFAEPEYKDFFYMFYMGEMDEDQAVNLAAAIREALVQKAAAFNDPYSAAPDQPRDSRAKALQVADFVEKGAFYVANA